MFKVVKMNVCLSLQSDLDLQIREHSYSTRGSGTYVVPFPRVECIKINYKYQFICSWNNLPEELKNTTTLSVFKKNYLSFLFYLFYGLSYCRLLSNSNIIIEPFIVNKKNIF